MLPKKARTALYDSVQKIWVLACVSVTAISTGYLGYQFYNYMLYVRPHKKEIEDRFKEELLKEGRMMKESHQNASN